LPVVIVEPAAPPLGRGADFENPGEVRGALPGDILVSALMILGADLSGGLSEGAFSAELTAQRESPSKAEPCT